MGSNLNTCSPLLSWRVLQAEKVPAKVTTNPDASWEQYATYIQQKKSAADPAIASHRKAIVLLDKQLTMREDYEHQRNQLTTTRLVPQVLTRQQNLTSALKSFEAFKEVASGNNELILGLTQWGKKRAAIEETERGRKYLKTQSNEEDTVRRSSRIRSRRSKDDTMSPDTAASLIAKQGQSPASVFSENSSQDPPISDSPSVNQFAAETPAESAVTKFILQQQASDPKRSVCHRSYLVRFLNLLDSMSAHQILVSNVPEELQKPSPALEATIAFPKSAAAPAPDWLQTLEKIPPDTLKKASSNVLAVGAKGVLAQLGLTGQLDYEDELLQRVTQCGVLAVQLIPRTVSIALISRISPH
ncbi:hypothetical protein HDU85_001632 [Gaertneriomyces sp. JEL0708]|nr:hypothetical protein HDU85_001632 [Gaertneriomyces sp. JEL0708]